MSKQKRVFRLNPDGDPETGMASSFRATNVIEGNPEKKFHRFFETNRKTMSEMRVSVVEGHAYSEKVENYPCDEMCLVLEGSVTVIDEDGNEENFEKGECFFMSQGFTGIWKQTDKFKKFAMTVCR